MPDNDATLRDATIQGDHGAPAGVPVSENPNESTPAETAGAQPATAVPHATVHDTADKDAAELGRLLIESGYGRDKINELLAAPNALKSIEYQVRNNPQEFLSMLERTDPDAARNFHEKMADMYVERYQVRDRQPQNGKSGAADSELMAELQAFEEHLLQLRALHWLAIAAHFICDCDPHALTRGESSLLPPPPPFLRVRTVSIARSPQSSQQDRVVGVITRDRVIFGPICVDLRQSAAVLLGSSEPRRVPGIRAELTITEPCNALPGLFTSGNVRGSHFF
jgi:hypothetical protein